MPTSFPEIHAADLAAFIFNVLAFTGYRWLQRARAQHDPHATLQSQQAALRAGWVSEVLASGNGILGVQTLRNAMMGAIFFASNTVFLVIGTLTLTLQGHLAHTWSLFDADVSVPLARTKLMLLLLTLLVAFFCFVNTIRLLAHASIGCGTKSAVPERVTSQLNSAWHYQGLGVRCYYFAVPVLFWLFGPVWFIMSCIAAIGMMHRFDRAPSRS